MPVSPAIGLFRLWVDAWRQYRLLAGAEYLQNQLAFRIVEIFAWDSGLNAIKTRPTSFANFVDRAVRERLTDDQGGIVVIIIQANNGTAHQRTDIGARLRVHDRRQCVPVLEFEKLFAVRIPPHWTFVDLEPERGDWYGVIAHLHELHRVPVIYIRWLIHSPNPSPRGRHCTGPDVPRFTQNGIWSLKPGLPPFVFAGAAIALTRPIRFFGGYSPALSCSILT